MSSRVSAGQSEPLSWKAITAVLALIGSVVGTTIGLLELEGRMKSSVRKDAAEVVHDSLSVHRNGGYLDHAELERRLGRLRRQRRP